MRTCADCPASIEDRGTTATRCVACAKERRRRIISARNKAKRGTPTERACATCHKMFPLGPRDGRARYCSPDCHKQGKKPVAKRTRRPRVKKEPKPSAPLPLCVSCAERPVSRRTATYCEPCREDGMARTVARKTRKTVVCVECHETFEPKRMKGTPPTRCLSCRTPVRDDDEDDGVALALLPPARPVEHAPSHDRAVLVGDDLSAFFLRQSFRVRRAQP